MIRSFAIILIGVLAMSAQDAKTHSLAGRVLDPAGGAVAGASVRLYSRTQDLVRGATSDAAGGYQFDRLPAGDYLVEARVAGLDQVNPAPVTIAGLTKLDLTLEIERLTSQVLITASSTPLFTDEAAKAIEVLDAESLERRGEITVSEALRVAPGVRVQQLGGPGSFVRILTRGLRAYDTSLTIDGMRFRDAGAVQADATAFLGDLLLVNSDRVEVLRGTGSSLYGSNALGGVINLVTDQGGGRMRGEISGEGGGLGLGRGLARMSGGVKENRLQYSAGLAHMNVNGGVDGIESVRNTGLQVFAQWRPTATSSLSARFMGNLSTIGVNSNPMAAPVANLPAGSGQVRAIALPLEQVRRLEQGLPVAWGSATFAPHLYDPDSRREGLFQSTMLAWTQQIAPRASYRVAYHHLRSERDNRNGPAGVGFQSGFGSSNRYDGQYDTLQARLDVALARTNLLSVGYEWEGEEYDNLATDENPNLASRVNARTGVRQRSHAIYVQDQLRFFSDRLLVNLSGRWQGFQLDRPTFTGGAPQYGGAALDTPPNAYTGDASLAYMFPRSGTKLRAHIGNGYRAPSLYERLGTSFFFGAFSAFGDPRLAPERTVAFDFGLDQYFSNSRYRLGATYFYTRLQSIIGFASLSNDPFGRWGGYVNTGGGLARGVEITGEARPARQLLVQGSYVYTNAIERRPILLDGNVRTIRVLPHAVTIVATQQITRRWQVTADFLGGSSYLSGTFFVGGGTRPYRFDGPRKLDTAISYTLPAGDGKSLRFFLRAENVLNQRYYEDGFRTPRLWATAGMKLSF
jgi:iron complex outermembrane receptor protein